MKKKHHLKEIVTMLGVTLAITGTALGDHRPGHRDQTADQRTETRTGDRSGNRMWNTVQTPVRYVSRAGRTVVRSPLIIGETLTGKRQFYSSSGFMTPIEEEADDANAPVNANEPQLSMPIGRGNRIPIRTPQND